MKRLSATDQNSNPLTNVPTPSSGGDAVNKTYVDTENAKKLNLTGGTLTGNLNGTTASFSGNATMSTAILNGSIDMNASNSQIFSRHNTAFYIRTLRTSATDYGLVVTSRNTAGTGSVNRLLIGTGADTTDFHVVNTSTFSVHNAAENTSAALSVNASTGATTLSGSLTGTSASFSSSVTATNYTTAISTKTSAYTITATDSVILANATSGAVTITLPTAASISGRQYTVKKIDAVNNVTLATTSSQTIDGSTTQVITSQYDSITVVSDGTNWHII